MYLTVKQLMNRDPGSGMAVVDSDALGDLGGSSGDFVAFPNRLVTDLAYTSLSDEFAPRLTVVCSVPDGAAISVTETVSGYADSIVTITVKSDTPSESGQPRSRLRRSSVGFVPIVSARLRSLRSNVADCSVTSVQGVPDAIAPPTITWFVAGRNRTLASVSGCIWPSGRTSNSTDAMPALLSGEAPLRQPAVPTMAQPAPARTRRRYTRGTGPGR